MVEWSPPGLSGGSGNNFFPSSRSRQIFGSSAFLPDQQKKETPGVNLITEMKAINDKLSFTKEFSSFVSVAYFFTHGILGQVAGIVVNYELLV